MEDPSSPDLVEDMQPEELAPEDLPPDLVEDLPGEDLVEEDMEPAPVLGLEERPINGTCLAPPRPPPVAGVRLEPVFEGLRFDRPVGMFQMPGDDTRWFVVEQSGRIQVFQNVEGVQAASVFVDISPRVSYQGERGLLGLAFHPEVASNRQVFLSYTVLRRELGAMVTALTRVSLREDALELDLDTEELIFQVPQPYGNHNGGTIAFGPDGYLYAGYGDGGSGGDPHGHGQNLQTWLGSVVRLDINQADLQRQTPYSIPPDNPFVGQDAQPEIWAYGLRNPWKFSFDIANGDLWAADVGQSLVEEVDLLVSGGNYGWKIYEGSDCFRDDARCGQVQAIGPVVEYPHEGRASVTGGFVYRGAEIPELQGAYLYADFVSGRIWAAMPDPLSATGYTSQVLIQSAGFAISSFGQDQDGEIYVVRYEEADGRIYRLVPQIGELPDNFPQRLSQTGCVDPQQPWRPSQGVIPYEINVPFWSDRAVKERWMAIPDGTQVGVDEDGDLDFPPGSVLIKHFRLEGRLIETRLLVRHEDGGWAGYTYAWEEDQSDARLLEGAQRREVGDQVWRYPGRAACLQCHNSASNFALGPELRQLERSATYFNQRQGDQVATLRHIGVLGELPRSEAARAPLATLDGSASLEERARSYLHSNCAYCHRPEGPGRGELDLRVTVPSAEARLCGVAPEEGDLDLPGALVVAPGEPARSLLWERMRRLDDTRMPSTLSTVLDEEGLALIEAWISAWGDCEDP